MVKPALGKGMKDLLAKNIVLGEQEAPVDKKTAKAELKTNIERFKAQEFDVTSLEELWSSKPEEIVQGIEKYRDAVKKLISAQTVIRSLEGYGYNEEIDTLMEDIKNPSKADKVLEQVEDLKERAMTEHNMKVEKKDAPKVKLSEALKAQSEKLNNQVEEDQTGEEITLDSLDGMLAELNEIGDAFSFGEAESDPITDEIKAWEAEGYFVDRLLTLLEEDRDAAIEEMKNFEQGILEMRILKERFRKMDLSAFPKEEESIKLKFQYPHMASEIRNELDSIDKRIDDSLREALPRSKEEEPPAEEPETPAEEPAEEPETPAEEVPAPEEAPVEEPPAEEPEAPTEEVPAPEEAPPEEPPAEEPEAPVEEMPEPTPEEVPAPEEAPAEEPPAEEPEPPAEEVPAPEEAPAGEAPADVSISPDIDLDQLMEMAKAAYREGDLDRSLEFFQEIIRRDPDNSKARFMIRRLSAKQ
ncbi:MAG: hypothetical protein ACMUHM_01260 [Thermoplasmatota archaeon]